MDEVGLEYKRQGADRSTGRIYHKDGGGHETLVSFAHEEFKSMLREFAKALQEYPEARAVWQRTDRPGLVPYYLDAEITNLFRTDPVAAIASMCPDFSSSPSSAMARVQASTVAPIEVRACFDTLADAFGDILYARYKKDRNLVECPGCGIWILYEEKLCCRNPKCRYNEDPIPAYLANDRWVGLKVQDLVSYGSPTKNVAAMRFFFPRAWNNGKPWISFEALCEKHSEYEKEKVQW